MFRYYLGVLFAKLIRRKRHHPRFNTKYKRAPARSIFLYSSRRVPFGRYGLGDSQTHAVPLAAAIFGGYNAARVWHFWVMWVYILFVVAACDSGFRRRLGHAAQHDCGLVNTSAAPEFTKNEQ